MKADFLAVSGHKSLMGPQGVPDLSEREQMLAARLDRLRQDQSLLSLLLGQGDSDTGFGAAFGTGKADV